MEDEVVVVVEVEDVVVVVVEVEDVVVVVVEDVDMDIMDTMKIIIMFFQNTSLFHWVILNFW
jgi:hypothetical protein